MNTAQPHTTPRLKSDRSRQRAALHVTLVGAGVAAASALWVGPPLAAWLVGAGVLILLLGLAMFAWAARDVRGSPKSVDTDYVRRFYETVRGLSQRAKTGTGSTERAAVYIPPPFAPLEWSEALILNLDWRRFEAVVEAFYTQAGFVTRIKPHGVNGGVDIWLAAPNAPETPVGVVQCRYWRDRPIGVEKLQALHKVMQEDRLKRAQFVTTADITNDAIAYARSHGIHLIGTRQLLELIARRTPDQQAALLKIATDGEWWRQTCGACGAKMVERGGKRGAPTFWGCETFPKCRHTMPRRPTATR
jgi:restriction system protein